MMRFIAVFLLVVSLPHIAAAKTLDIQEITSPGGIRAWLVEDHSVPVISINFAFKGAGAAQDSVEKQGLTRLVSNMLDEGAGEMDSQSFQKSLQDNSVTLRFNATRDDFNGSLKTLTQNKEMAFSLLKIALTAPRFDDDALLRMQAANKSRLRSSLSNPDWTTARVTYDQGFAGHPYALNSGGTISTLDTITPQDLKDAVAARLAQDILYVGVAGDITADELSIILDFVFGELPAVASILPIPDISLQNTGRSVVFEKDIPQSVIQMLQPGIGRTAPDYHHAQIMNFVLGASGFGSRLTEEIREKRGLTYGIYSNLFNFDHVKTLLIKTSTANTNVPEMISLINAEWTKMRDLPISAQELETAQTYLIGALPLSLTSTNRISRFLLDIMRDDLPADYLTQRESAIRSASIEDVQHIAQRLLTPENFLTIITGKPKGINADITVQELPNAN